jgi:signal transduction histidine kinase
VLRLIHLEDDLNDRELVAGALRADGILCSLTSVEGKEAFEAALEDRPDLILADFKLPGFDGIQAQEIAARRCPDVPFVFVSGSMGEEIAVERLKCGATDYVLKHNLDKLPSAVRRAIREAEERRQRVRAEEDLRRLNAELETRVRERTLALKEANDALERARQEADRANLAKSDFLSRMSHDLRTPLNAVMGFAQMMQFDDLSPDHKESVTQILRGGRHLLDLINEVLDIARIEAGRLSVSPEPIDVDSIVGHAIELIRPLAAERRITVQVESVADAHVLADRQRLNQVLLNLLSNAVKYNREGGRVTVSAQYVTPDRVSIVVTDTGAGIPAAKMALLFLPFERLGAEQTGVEGTGLGLALSKGLVGAMGGSLTVKSVVDQGTSFFVELPSSDAPAPREAPGRGEQSDAIPRSGTVLYIEDNFANLLLMRRLLATCRPGIELVHASSGAAGLDAVTAHHPDVILLDSHLPDIAGEEVLRQLWEDPATRQIPVAILSADATLSRQRSFLAAGAITYLTKPFDVDDVLELIDRLLGRQGSRGENA